MRRVSDRARERLSAARAQTLTLAPPTAPAEETHARVLMVEPSEPSIDEGVPRGVRVAAAWAWRLLILGAVAYLLFKVLGMLSLLMIPVGISLLLAALLSPGVSWLVRHGLPKPLAVVMVMIGGLAAVAGVLTIVIQAFVAGLGDLTAQVQAGLNQIRDWLVQAFSVSQNQIDDAIQSATDALTKNQSSLTSGFLSTATTLTHVIAGFFLVLFSTFFFLKDGRIIWSFIVNLLPRPARVPVAEAGEHGWHTLISYVRATVLVAFVDAMGIGLALVAIRVPLALPLAALVFLGAFIPVVGATLSGAVAILVALVEVSPLAALLTLLAVIAVQQLEGHVLQPLLLGRAVALHPLGVIMALTTGVITGGIIGALVAVPMVAVLNTAIRYLVQYRARTLPPGAPDPPGTRSTDERQAKVEDRVEDPAKSRVTPSPRPRRSRQR